MNESSAHYGEGDYGLHIRVEVNYEGFKNMALIDQHKLIQGILKEDIGRMIHSLSIKTFF